VLCRARASDPSTRSGSVASRRRQWRAAVNWPCHSSTVRSSSSWVQRQVGFRAIRSHLACTAREGTRSDVYRCWKVVGACSRVATWQLLSLQDVATARGPFQNEEAGSVPSSFWIFDQPLWPGDHGVTSCRHLRLRVGSGRPSLPSSPRRSELLNARLRRRGGSRKRRDCRGHSGALDHKAAAKWISPKAPLKRSRVCPGMDTTHVPFDGKPHARSPMLPWPACTLKVFESAAT